MNATKPKLLATVATLALGALALGSTLAAMPEQQSEQQYAPGSGQTQASEQIIQGKPQEACARLDKDRDGYLTLVEFKDTKRLESIFKTADANQDGRLDMKECVKVLGSS